MEKNIVGRFLCGRPSAAVPPDPISCVSGLLPFPVLPSLTDGARLSVPSSPKSSPAPRPRVLAGKIPIVEPATSRVLAPPQCPPAIMSRRVGCGMPWHAITTAAHRSSTKDARARSSTMKPRAACPAGRADEAECTPLGHHVPSLTEASRHPTASVDRCHGRCAATMPTLSTR
jgi:hypothetical protein